ncbi:hypothetical protein GGR43_002376 [Sphingobium jiangsuense]|uniref:C-type lysozyme inhibitor domain-containing protein n=1 Tax=Sphingobium jiangsuense TaxID=870476 RepID=A0A7W6BGQ3_9SPHN|nr:hypothetical protein [Sphingobium jiangsuense]MBB3926656.1 hypothetical protein [Sphingobium jiangsuense]
MKPYLSLIALPTLLALAACGNNEPEVVGGGPADPMADQLNNAAPVELPPMVKKSKTYRCKDSSLVYVDYMSDDKTVMLRTEKEGVATKLTADETGTTFKADGGWSLTGPEAEVTVEMPGKGSQSCKA